MSDALLVATNQNDLKDACDAYLGARTGHYAYRRLRYSAVIDKLGEMGLTDADTVVDVGAGWTELGYCLYAEYDWRGRYFPIDGGLDGTDLEDWTPPVHEFYVLCEVLEHLYGGIALSNKLNSKAKKGVAGTVPNPDTTDVLGMDPTHVRADLTESMFGKMGYETEVHSFYGQPDDSILFWRAK